MQLASGNIYGVQTEARLSWAQMMAIARSRLSGEHPITPGIRR